MPHLRTLDQGSTHTHNLCLVVVVPDEHSYAQEGDSKLDCYYQYVMHNKKFMLRALTSRTLGGITTRRLVFRLSSTPKRLLGQMPNGVNDIKQSLIALCLGAIMEFTAAGQSEIHTHVPN